MSSVSTKEHMNLLNHHPATPPPPEGYANGDAKSNGYISGGEVKHKMDVSSQLSHENGLDKLNLTTEQDILLSTISNYLVEPSLAVPMTIGLYSRWGSGRSTYIIRLIEYLYMYKEQVPLRPFTITFCLSLAIFSGGFTAGLIVSAVAGQQAGSVVGMCFGGLLLVLFVFSRCSVNSANNTVRNTAISITVFLHRLMILLKLAYCVPACIEEYRSVLPVQLVIVELTEGAIMEDGPISPLLSFTEALNDAVEDHFGMFIPRLYRIFQNRKTFRSSHHRAMYTQWKTSCCCIPSFMITVFIFLCLWIAIILYNIYSVPGPITVMAIQIACCCVFGGGLISYILRTFLMVYCMLLPMKKRIQIVANRVGVTEATFLSVLKHELDLYVDMIECVNGFTHRQTRIVVHIDLVDTLEQQKVLNVINSINLLLTEPSYPFILVVAVDPRLLVKALEQTFSNMADPVASPFVFIKNMVDLPCYINEYTTLRCDHVIPRDLLDQLEEAKFEMFENDDDDMLEDWGGQSAASNFSELENGHVPIGDGGVGGGGLQRERSVKFPSDESMGSLVQQRRGDDEDEDDEENISEDISHLLRNNENNSINDVRRIMNVVSLTGRILSFQNVPFQWTRLAIWISFCDGWPYKASWITLLCTDSTLNLPSSMSIRRVQTLFGFLMPVIGDRHLGNDSTTEYLDTFIASQRPIIRVDDVRAFSAFIFYIDPTIRKLMVDYLMAIKTNNNKQQQQQQQIPLQHQPLSTGHTHDQVLGMTIANPDLLLRMSVDDVVNQLLVIKGMNEPLLPEYKGRLIDNNINGRVLLACDLNDLRDVMQMGFGDWQLFRAWVLASRDEYQSMRGEGKRSIDHRSMDSHSDSIARGNINRGRATQVVPPPRYRNKSQEKQAPYSSHLTPQVMRKTLKDTKTGSVSQDGDYCSPPPHYLHDHVLHQDSHVHDHVLNHSQDSGFASTEVDQNHQRLMLSLQRQNVGVPEYDEPTESRIPLPLVTTNVVELDVETPHSTPTSSTVSNNTINTVRDIVIHQPGLNDTTGIKSDTEPETESEIDDVTLLHNPSDGPRPPSLSDVPLPPLSMLNEGETWPIIPPKEFDDPSDTETLPPELPSGYSEHPIIQYRTSGIYRGGLPTQSNGIESPTMSHKSTSTMSEPYTTAHTQVPTSSRPGSSLKKSASYTYYDYNNKKKRKGNSTLKK